MQAIVLVSSAAVAVSVASLSVSIVALRRDRPMVVISRPSVRRRGGASLDWGFERGWYVQLTVRNVGRSAIQIEQAWFTVTLGPAADTSITDGRPAIPASFSPERADHEERTMLEPGTSVTVHAFVPGKVGTIASPVDVVAGSHVECTLNLADGRQLRSKRSQLSP